MKIIQKNVTSFLKTENKELLSLLRKKYSAKIPGASYSKAYKHGWDGTKYFITEKGQIGTGLIPFIEQDLIAAELDYSIQDERDPLIGNPFIEVEGLKYRGYQETLIRKALEAGMGLIEDNLKSLDPLFKKLKYDRSKGYEAGELLFDDMGMPLIKKGKK